MTRFLISLLTLLFAGFIGSVEAKEPPKMEIMQVWGEGSHCAFTDLIRYNNRFYCTFREGENHVPTKPGQANGKIRILRSKDGKSWQSVALVEKEGRDLRDPKLSITPDGRLMILMGASDYTHAPKLSGCLTHVSFMDKAERVSEPQPVEIDPAVRNNFDWLWRVTWHKGVAYGVIYRKGGGWEINLVKSTDGIHYDHVTSLNVDGNPNESTVFFTEEGDMRILVRREAGQGADKYIGRIGCSKAPYTEWEWKPLNYRLNCPSHVITLPNGAQIYGGRHFAKHPKNRPIYTMLYRLNEDLTEEPILRIDEGSDGQDCAYPGLVVYKKNLWVSFYSTYKKKSSIYIAKVPLALLEEHLQSTEKK